jgi:hypothetical protein
MAYATLPLMRPGKLAPAGVPQAATRAVTAKPYRVTEQHRGSLSRRANTDEPAEPSAPSRLEPGRTADHLRALLSAMREANHPGNPLVRRFRVRIVGNCQPAAASLITFVKRPGIQRGEVCHSLRTVQHRQ